METYKLAVCGGTFDLLHKGHKEFLQFILSNTKKAVLGLTSDLYTKEYKTATCQPYEVRKKAVEEYLTNINSLERVTIVPIDDPYGPSVTDEYSLDVIIVTDDTKKGAEKINEIRASKNLSILPIVSTELVIGEDGEFISSKRVREGIINRDGRLFIYEAWYSQTFLLPEEKRADLQKPMGELITDFEEWIKNNILDYSRVGSVGDVVTSILNKHKCNQKLSIFDFVVERKETYHTYKELGFSLPEEEVITVDNTAGTVNGKVFEILKVFFSEDKKQGMLKVKGEEDLLVLPVILAAPLGFTILYGQPKQGVVKIDVTEEVKESSFSLLSSFQRKT